MDPRTGELFNVIDADRKKELLSKVLTKAEAIEKGLIEVKRELTHKEKMEMQIRLYSPCACGSGKKFKFCHYKP